MIVRSQAKKIASTPPIINQNQTLVEKWFVGDGIQTEFKLTPGFNPFSVFNDGLRAKMGDADQFTIIYDGFIYSVKFLIAPANGADICIEMERNYEN